MSTRHQMMREEEKAAAPSKQQKISENGPPARSRTCSRLLREDDDARPRAPGVEEDVEDV